MGEAVGILEVFGLVCAFMAADAGCKAGNVWLEPFDKNKPANADSLPVPLLVTIKFRGKRFRCGSGDGSGRTRGPQPYGSGAEAYHPQAHGGYGKNAQALRI